MSKSKLRLLISQANTLKRLGLLARNRFSQTQGQQPPIGSNQNLNATTFNSQPGSYEYYSAFRIYKNQSWYDLCNLVVMTTCCTNSLFVDNCHHLYNISRKVLGKLFSEP